jgi:hypothetical protein
LVSFAIVMAAFTFGPAYGQRQKIEYDIIGPPSQDLRRTIANAAGDYLSDLPVAKGSEISDEIGLRMAQKLHVVCVRRKLSDGVGGNPTFSSTGVTLVRGLPQQAFADHFACRNPKLKFYPFVEMH